jgi:hypothetical protein
MWALEKCLGQRPGTFSRLLGYLPLSVESGSRAAPSIEEALAADRKLDQAGLELMLQTYSILTAKRRRK